MKIELISKFIDAHEINFDKVQKVFLNEHNPKNHQWPIHLLEQANKQVGGWIEVKLPLSVIKEVKLPYHHHTKEGVMLIPRKGMIAKEVYSKFKKNKIYKNSNPKCYAIVKRFKSRPVGTIFLSTVSANGRDSYSKNEIKKHLLHIDGLHRILALIGRNEKKLIKCILAVKPERISLLTKKR